MIRTPSLVLRHFVPEDAAELMRLNAEESTRRWLPSHVYGTLAEADVALSHLIAQCRSPGDPRLGPYVLAVEHLESGKLLGHVGFSPLHAEVEVSYAIAERERGKGYASEALLHACRWASRTFGLDGIVAVTATGNAASRRTLERAGFVHASDGRMIFQGTEQAVSRYRWHA